MEDKNSAPNDSTLQLKVTLNTTLRCFARKRSIIFVYY